ncbi:MAG: YitT family protein [Desulfobacterales bacterium]|nr:YitT family protein [Desulfobacterales bacterium]
MLETQYIDAAPGGPPLDRAATPAPAPRFGALIEFARNLGLICLGGVLMAVAVNGILIPQKFLGGGVTGVALLIHYLFPAWPTAAVFALLNIPIFLLGWAFVGRRFFFYSILGMTVLTASLSWIHVTLPVHDKILSALLAGVLSGLGAGLTLRSRGSMGGTDILSVILLNLFSLSVGKTFLAFNILVLASALVIFSLEAVLYTLICMYVASRVMNLVVMGLSKRKAVFIISTQWEKISRKILDNIGRGMTVLRGQGGYSGKEERVLYTVISLRELHRLKDHIRELDPEAFVVVQDTLEVMGRRIGNQPHW